MKEENVITKMMIKIGKTAANTSMNTNCPWIHYQPKEPKAMIEARKSRNEI